MKTLQIIFAALVLIGAYLTLNVLLRKTTEIPKEAEHRIKWVEWKGMDIRAANTGKFYHLELGFRDDGMLMHRIGSEVQGGTIK